MSTMVTARIPDELFDQGKMLLNELGATQTDLVRAAYEYLMKTGSLPSVEPQRVFGGRSLTKEQLADLADKLGAATIPVDFPEDWDYKRAIEEGRRADYEAFA